MKVLITALLLVTSVCAWSVEEIIFDPSIQETQLNGQYCDFGYKLAVDDKQVTHCRGINRVHFNAIVSKAKAMRKIVKISIEKSGKIKYELSDSVSTQHSEIKRIKCEESLNTYKLVVDVMLTNGSGRTTKEVDALGEVLLSVEQTSAKGIVN